MHCAAQNNSNLPKIVSTAVVVLGHGTRLIAGEVGKRLAAQLHQLQGSVPADVAQVSDECTLACLPPWSVALPAQH